MAQRVQRIDAHQHYWDPERGDYFWMLPDAPIARVFGPEDLQPLLAAHGFAQTVLVQAAPTLAETEYLLKIAGETATVAKVVGWIDFEDPTKISALERFAAHPKFVGVRPMIQDIPEDDWMLRPDLDWVFRAIEDLDLTFDCLGFPRHLANFHRLLLRHEGMRAVLGHCLKPRLERSDSFDTWAEGMRKLAEDTGAYCKVSGLVTEAEHDWSDNVLCPYVHHVIDVFGPDRVMFGSDWPVCLLRCQYSDWVAQAARLSAHLGEKAQAKIFGETAKVFYRIG
nr:amidohydrolase family protein [Ruegeria arenilitoris]